MIKVDVSVYCRLLRRPEKLEKNIILAVAGLIFEEKIFYRYLWRVLSKMYGGLLLLIMKLSVLTESFMNLEL